MTTASPTVRRRDLGARLRQYRDRKGLNGKQVADATGRSDSWVSRLELGRTGIRAETLSLLLDLYEVTDPEERRELVALARSGRERGWWSRYASVLSKTYSSYIGFEESAVLIRSYEALVPPGLLQTEEYARILMATSAPREDRTMTDRKVEVRLNRQRRLTSDRPLELLAVIDEAVLHRVIGGDVDVHRRQLEHLLALPRTHPNVRLQVVPFGHSVFPSQLASFAILEFADARPEIVYIETLTADLYEEPPESTRYKLAHDDLRAAALGESASAALIEAVLASPALNGGRHRRANRKADGEVAQE